MVSRPEDFEGSDFRKRLTFVYWIGSDLRTARIIKDAEEQKEVFGHYAWQLVQGLSCCSIAVHLLTHDATLGILAVDSWSFRVWRWLLSFGFFYNSLHMVDVVYNFPLLSESICVEKMMNNPLMSTSLKDFWAVRWDRAVQMMLKDCAYIPLRKCGCSRGAAVAGTFFASGVLHCYGIVCGGIYDFWLCGSILAFFCVQPLLLSLETMLTGEAETSVNLTWTLVLASPFFLEPVCALFESIEV
jgi:hypothetical protein